MSWFILSAATTFCYIVLTLSLFFPGKFIQIKNIETFHKMNWMLLAMSIASLTVTCYLGFEYVY